MSETPVTRAEFEALLARLASLEAELAALRPAPPEPVDGLDPDTVRVIAAAVAAYLGKRATIKVVRRVSDDSDSWRSFGRANLAAGRSLPRVRGVRSGG